MLRCPLSTSVRTNLLLAASVVLYSGCSIGPDIGQVTGQVTLDGAPLKNALVSFLPMSGGRPGTAMTDADGHYELRFNGTRMGALIGRHEVKISTFYPPSMLYDDNGKQVITPERAERLPKRYHEQTELTADVQPGATVLDFALQSK